MTRWWDEPITHRVSSLQLLVASFCQGEPVYQTTFQTGLPLAVRFAHVLLTPERVIHPDPAEPRLRIPIRCLVEVPCGANALIRDRTRRRVEVDAAHHTPGGGCNLCGRVVFHVAAVLIYQLVVLCHSPVHQKLHR